MALELAGKAALSHTAKDDSIRKLGLLFLEEEKRERQIKIKSKLPQSIILHIYI